MKNRPRNIFLSFILLSSFFHIAVNQDLNMGMHYDNDIDVTSPELMDVQSLSFSDMGMTDQVQLQGPFQDYSLEFALPPDWRVNDDLDIELVITIEFQSLLQAFTSEVIVDGLSLEKGYLRVSLNGDLVGEKVIAEDGEFMIEISVPVEIVNQDTELNDLVISWDASAACDQSITSLLTISTASKVNIPHSTKSTSLRLKDFPSPFKYDRSVIEYPVAFIVPDDPDADDLSALLAVSSAFGKLGGHDFSYEILSAADLNQAKHADYHFVLIGDLEEVNGMLESKLGGNRIIMPAGVMGTGSGYLKYAISPWNSGRTILVITGEYGAAVYKAASILTADQMIPYSGGNDAVVKDVIDTIGSSQFQIDHLLGNLISENSLQASTLGETIVKIPFSIPGDMQISPEVYLELYFRHSQLINYLQSSISVYINGNLIGTIRFSDHTAENGLMRIILPPNVLRPLMNELQITFTVTPQDICADERSGNYWITVFGDSYLHIPPVLEVETTPELFTLNNLPRSLMKDSSFSNLVYVISEEEENSWKYASRLAFLLGVSTDANIIQPALEFCGDVSEFENGKDYILIGDMGSVPFESGVNDYLPLPIGVDGKFAQEPLEGIQFEMDEGQDIGVIQSARIPDKNTTVIGVFGNSAQGVSAAVNKLIEQIRSGEAQDANLVLIDGVGESHYYQIAQKITDAEGGAAGHAEWFEHFSNLMLQKPAFPLLIVFLVISIAFVTWAIRKK